jgi:hypothetical protein
MLRYSPSLDFSLSTTPAQSFVLVQYESEAFAVVQCAMSSDEKALSFTNQATAVSTRLRSLLDFARWVNERERDTVTLDSFLRKAQGERNEVKAAFDERTAVSETCAPHVAMQNADFIGHHSEVDE